MFGQVQLLARLAELLCQMLFNEYHKEHLAATQESPQMLDVTLTVARRG